MYADLSEHSHTAAFAWSSALPILPNGIASSTAFACSGTSFDHARTLSVNVMPGQIELTRMPCFPNSNAAVFVSPFTPHFDEAYADNPGDPNRPDVDAVLTIAPPPDSSIAAISYFKQ